MTEEEAGMTMWQELTFAASTVIVRIPYCKGVQR